ncbi:MAG TPA: hypothetical protein VF054_02475 [Micromonosporaceae bacterium]
MRRRIIAALFALGVALGGVLVTEGAANAKITSVDTSCENQGGNLPQGQQPTCTGGGLTQNTENQNPAGHAPPGQNP